MKLNELLPGVCALLCTLNNERDIEGVLSSLLESSPDQIIVVDGSSTDRTVELAKKYTKDVFVTKIGFVHQIAKGVDEVKYNHLLCIESDHRYPKGFIQNLKLEFDQSNFCGVQATLVCNFERNFFERGLSSFYKIHQIKKGKKEIIGGPAIYKTEVFREYFKPKIAGFSTDTQVAETARSLGLTFGLGYTTASQYEPMDINRFLTKYMTYGHGDYFFYTGMAPQWSFSRKLKSVTHIAKRYFFHYPALAIIKLDFEGAAFLVMAGMVRYYGWSKTYLKKQLGHYD